MRIKLPYRIQELIVKRISEYMMEVNYLFGDGLGEQDCIDLSENTDEMLEKIIDLLNSEQEINGNIIHE